ncbi:DNA polymerase III subunit epsilon [Corynebacterium sp. 13CS0277]|uniref:exonuclease domain-containing protein n=1 Tax=Corynebacterium sp. 13CS0277 TaxID=2071994 RepID=UPI000D03C64A|nr:exonuclease domain-containing protein [Corynebacterium sp. 13CS0277]PRQ12502.1 DNA polymerase III subunit epsilon [Corynebacterium sp. 13CS0277]
MSVSAHGSTISVTRSDNTLHLVPSPLQSSLGATTQRVPLSDITGVRLHPPTALVSGTVHLDGADVDIVFAPGRATQAAQVAEELQQLLDGGSAPLLVDSDVLSTGPKIPGLDFVALDVETANADNGSICQVGLARVVDGRVTETASWLCQPPAHLDVFEEGNIAIHGIRPEDVADAATFAEVWEQARAFIGEDIVVSHYVQFDGTAVQRAAEAAGIDLVPFRTACTVALAKATNVGQVRNGLKPMTEALGIDLAHHHDAEADAIACAEIFIRLARREDFTGSAVDYFHTRGFTLGEVTAEHVTHVQAAASGADIPAQRAALGLAPLAGAAAASQETSAAPRTSTRRRAPQWRKARTPDVIPEPNPTPPEGSPFVGHVVVFSGDFGEHDKGQLWAQVAALGGQVAKNVTKKTTMLVLGTWEGITTKQKRAEELIAKGQEIHLLSADELLGTLAQFPEAAAALAATPALEDSGFTPEDLTPPF